MQVRFRDAALLAARGDGRVALDDQLGVRLVPPRGGDHVGEALRRGQAAGDGGVAQRLVHQKDAPARLEHGGVERPAHVGLGQARSDDAVDQAAGARFHRGVAPVRRVRDQPLQAARPGCVVIDSDVVDDQADAGGARLAQADRAQKAVLQCDIGAIMLRRPAPTGRGRGLHAPPQNRLNLRARQATQVVFRQEGLKERDLQHAGRADPGGRGSGRRGGGRGHVKPHPPWPARPLRYRGAGVRPCGRRSGWRRDPPPRAWRRRR